jgi:hypothetical protein
MGGMQRKQTKIRGPRERVEAVALNGWIPSAMCGGIGP